MGVRAEEEEVALQKREKKKKKKNKKTEVKAVCGETIALQGEDYELGLGRIKKKGQKNLEDKKGGGCKEMDSQFAEKDLNDNDHTGSKSEKKKRRLEHGEKKKGNYDDYCNKEKKESMKEKEVKKKRNKNKEDMSSFTEVLQDKEVGDKETGVEHDEREAISDLKEMERRNKPKKKEKKEKKSMDKEVSKNMQPMGLDHLERESKSDIKEWEESGKQKKKKERREKNIARNQELRKDEDRIDVGSEINIEYRHEGKSKRENKENDNEGGFREFVTGKSIDGGRTTLPDHTDVACNDGLPCSGNRKRDRGGEVFDVESKKRNMKSRKTDLTEDFKKKRVDMGEPNPENKGEGTSDDYKTSKPKDSRKKVKFSDHVEEVFPSSIAGDVGEEKEDNLVRGKRFTRKEDDLVKDAIEKYIKDHNLGEKGKEMVLKCQKYRISSCWREIGAALPWRPVVAVKRRAHILLTRAETRRWTEDELAFLVKFHKENGPKWKEAAELLGKNYLHVKDRWRRLRSPEFKRGPWSQEEVQTLFDLVNMDLRMKVFEEKKQKHGMLRDNIRWTVISNKMRTRNEMESCAKWYQTLRSPMVRAKEWDDTDDYRLLDELVMLDACCVEDVDWDNLLEHRSGLLCRKRWRQMVNQIGQHGIKSFPEQVDVLSKRYCPNLVEVKEALASKPVDSEDTTN